MSTGAELPQIIIAPDDLTEREQWLLWRYEMRNDKPNDPTKVPYQTNGKRASSADPTSWTSYDRANGCFQRTGSCYSGIGFVFSGDDPFAGIDLDDCLDSEGNVKPWAASIVERFSDTYMEISPSGAGLKIFSRGALPANLPGVKVGDGQIEMYDHKRYFAVTGRAFRGAPLEIEEHASDLLRLYQGLTTGGRKTWALQPQEGGRIPYGEQHSMLVSFAGTLRARRICEEAIEACLQIVNECQCEKPGPRENISRIVRSSRKWGVA